MSYEVSVFHFFNVMKQLLDLEDKIGTVSRAAPKVTKESLPTRTFRASENTTGQDKAVCLVCMGEFEEGDTVKTLPCVHEFHKYEENNY